MPLSASIWNYFRSSPLSTSGIPENLRDLKRSGVKCLFGEPSESAVRILFVASEGLPFSKTGGLADVVEALPKALVAQGHEVAAVVPRYRGTKATGVGMPSLTNPMGGARLRFSAVADGAGLDGVRDFFLGDA